MEWMEALLPGSSEHLQRFSRSGSHHGPHMSSEDPYSLAGTDLAYSNGTHGTTVDLTSSWDNSVRHQPLNYMEPVRIQQHSNHHSDHHLPAQRTQSETTMETSAESTENVTSMSADSRIFHSSKEHPRQAPHRSTFTHSERQHHQVAGLSRSRTERTPSRSPEGKVPSDGVDAPHLYELELGGVTESVSKRPPVPSGPPPRAKPRPAPRHTSGSSQANASRSPISKEPEFQEKEKPHSDKPAVTPRKPRPVDRPQKEPDYLALVGGGGQARNVPEPDTQANTGSRNVVPGISEQMMQNFTPDQLDMLITMLQQVQSGGKLASEQPAAKEVAQQPERGANEADLSGSLIRRNFSECPPLVKPVFHL